MRIMMSSVKISYFLKRGVCFSYDVYQVRCVYFYILCLQSAKDIISHQLASSDLPTSQSITVIVDMPCRLVQGVFSSITHYCLSVLQLVHLVLTTIFFSVQLTRKLDISIIISLTFLPIYLLVKAVPISFYQIQLYLRIQFQKTSFDLTSTVA